MFGFVNEIDMFSRGIKPAVYGKDGKISRLVKKGNFFVNEFAGGYLVSHDPTNVTNSLELGVALGYYPLSCEGFVDKSNNLYQIGIDFNGIRFSTMGFEEEALVWCLDQYGEKTLQKFKSIRVKLITVDPLTCREKVLKKYKLQCIKDIQELKTFVNEGLLNC